MPELPNLPPIAKAPLSLVLLASNAAPHLADLLRGWRDVLLAREVPFEIIVVDDASGDGTGERAEELAASLPELKLLRHDQPRGSGAALRTGLAQVRHPLIACAPCDPAYRPEDLTRFLAQIDPVHFLTGYRAGARVPLLARGVGHLWRLFCRIVFNNTGERLPGWLGWRGHLGALLARVFFGVRLRDVACPYRLFRREVLARSPLQSNGDFAWVEQLAKVNFSNGVFGHEVPVPVTPQRQPPSWARFRALFREAKHVFSHPTFGPTFLPEPEANPPASPAV